MNGGRRLIKTFVVICLLSVSPALFAQSVPAAEGGSFSLWAGAEASSFNPDWGCSGSPTPFTCWDNQLQGITAFADVNRVLGKIGMEGETRWLIWNGPRGDINEKNFLLGGPRFQVFAGRRLSVNAKFLAGGSIFDNKNGVGRGGWATYAPGATLGYRLSHRLMLRADYEYQIWPGFAGPLGAHGLTPNGFSVGVSYRILR
jgi:hypothetical protein